MSDLAEFLLARIEGDQIDATMRTLHAGDCGWFPDPAGYTYPCDCGVPERMAREAEAKRRIVEMHPTWRGTTFAAGPTFGTEVELCRRCDAFEHKSGDTRAYAPCTTLRLLALPYADHPDFRPEWRADD